VLWIIVVAATLTILTPLPAATSGRDAVFNAFTGSLRDLVRPWAIAFDVAGAALLPLAWLYVRSRR